MAKREPDEFVRHVLELMEPLGPVGCGRLFGGWGIRQEGRLFAVVIRDRLYLCADAAMQAELEAAGCDPFRYAKRGRTVTVRKFFSAPEGCLDDADLLADWARRALARAD
jgi:DNA transformation protein and related proteins